MNKIVYQILPIYYKEITIDKKLSEVIDILKQIIHKDNHIDYPYKGNISKEEFKFSKRDISLNVKSELVFKGKNTSIDNNSTKITIKGRYKFLPAVSVLILMVIFLMVAWSTENYLLRLILPLTPYIVIVIRIKIKSPNILYDLERALK